MFEPRFAQRYQGMSGNVIREILKLTQRPEVISFAGGLPSPLSFPTARLAQLSRDLIEEQGMNLLQYGTSEGLPNLRYEVSRWMEALGRPTRPEEVLITSGSQQGIDLVARAILDPGSVVLVERPTYLAALQIFKAAQAQLVSVKTDEEGIDLESLEIALAKHKPALLYLVPNFQNPTGITLAAERREKVVQLAQKAGCLVVEDDPYGALRFSGQNIRPLASWDQQGSVVYLGSSSKIIAPGLRVGFAVSSQPELFRRMVLGKQGTDVHTSNLSQALVAEFLSGEIHDHLKKILPSYLEKRNLMLALMEEHFPADVSWTKPDGGLFIWCTLPEGVDTTALLKRAVEEESVAFIPGESFYADGGIKNTMRLNFSHPSLEKIQTGIQRLGRIMRNI